MSRAITYKPKKSGAMRRVFNALSYFPPALGDFLLLRPINQHVIMKKYINDESIDLQDPKVQKELQEELEYDQLFSMVPIPGLKELASNWQRRATPNNDRIGVFSTSVLCASICIAGFATLAAVLFGPPLLGLTSYALLGSGVLRLGKYNFLGAGTDIIINQIVNKRAKSRQKRLAHIKKTSPLLN